MIRSRLSTLRGWLRHSGALPVAHVVTGYLAARALSAGIQRYTPPAIADFTGTGAPIVTTAPALLAQLGYDASAVAAVQAEYPAVAAGAADRCARVGLRYPRGHAVEAQTAAAVYGLVRLLRPRCVVETGVADGWSSYAILAALARNGDGTLHSFDILLPVGGLVGHHPQWRLTVLDAREPDRCLRAALAGLGPVDLFLHDSDHRYLSQLFEYRQAWRRLASGGVLISDDVDDSRAFIHFCARARRRPVFLFDSRKIVGVVRP